MSQTKNPAQELLKRCRQVDAGTEQHIDTCLRKLANEVQQRQMEILEKVTIYRKGLLQRENPSVEEFYDLFDLATHSEHKFSHEVSVPYLDDKLYSAWCARTSAPSLPERRYIMLAILDQYLECRVFSGLGRLSQSLSPTYGGDLFPGSYCLSARPMPSAVTFLETCDCWEIADVILPNWCEWHDRPCNMKALGENHLYGDVQDFVGDLMMVDIIMPAGCNPRASLHARLQKIRGVGARRARSIIAWLEAIGCRIEKKR
jgi:hypothetical protein